MSVKTHWNVFVSTYAPGKYVTFRFSVSRKAPPRRTNKGMKLPTARKLLEDWCRKNLAGPWSTDAKQQSNISYVELRVANTQDAQLLIKRFRAYQNPKALPNSGEWILEYRNESYRQLAIEMGFDL